MFDKLTSEELNVLSHKVWLAAGTQRMVPGRAELSAELADLSRELDEIILSR